MWWILAQRAADFADEYGPVQNFGHSGPLTWVSWLLASWWYFYLPFVLWMAIYCARRDTESRTWLWIILVFHPFGALVYFVVRFLPSVQFSTPKFLHRFTRGQEVRKLEIAAAQIGNAHQFVELGDLHRELGQWDRAGQAYTNALKKDAHSLPALWGAATVEFRQKKFDAAKNKTRQILDRDFTYKFGDVSLLHAKALFELQDRAAAQAHLEQHVRRWRHPEALYLLASILVEQGETDVARGHLQSMIQDIEASPRAIARKFFFWKGRAKRLLRRLR